MQVPSPQKGYRTGIDGLLHKSEPDGFIEVCTSPSSIPDLTVTQPPSLDEEYEDIENGALRLLDLIHSQQPHPNPDWLAKFCENSNCLYKYVDDNFRNKTHHTLPKTNEHDQCNQPLPANVIGCHFRTLRCHDHTTLWIVAQVKGPGHQLSWVREPALTYLVDRWEPLGQGAGKAPTSATGG